MKIRQSACAVAWQLKILLEFPLHAKQTREMKIRMIWKQMNVRRKRLGERKPTEWTIRNEIFVPPNQIIIGFLSQSESKHASSDVRVIRNLKRGANEIDRWWFELSFFKCSRRDPRMNLNEINCMVAAYKALNRSQIRATKSFVSLISLPHKLAVSLCSFITKSIKFSNYLLEAIVFQPDNEAQSSKSSRQWHSNGLSRVFKMFRITEKPICNAAFWVKLWSAETCYPKWNSFRYY